MTGYIARDENGDLYFYEYKPVKDTHVYKSTVGCCMYLHVPLPQFNNLRFDDDPVEVELEFKIK